MSEVSTADARHARRSDTAIEFKHVHKWYGEFHVLRDIDLDGRAGRADRHLRAVGLGQVDADPLHQPARAAREGRIIVDGIELTNDLRQIEKVRAEVGMVFQQFNLFPHLTVLENLCLAPMWVREDAARGGRETRACSSWNACASPSRRNKYPGQLSGGQQQRVAIARALVHEPAASCCSTSRPPRSTPRW